MPDKKIIRRPARTDPAQFSELHPVLRQIYAARSVQSMAELDCGLQQLLHYQDLLHIDRAARCLADAVMQGKRILILGDFDADGATSCALAVRVLRAMGAAWVHYVVPNRFEYGYGLTPEIVAVAARHSPDVLVTVDNGIASVAGVDAAKASGMQVIITDHHLPGRQLPKADAIVNPNQPGCPFASKHVAGVGVIFYVMLALRACLREQDWFKSRPEPNLAQWLDLVALGTVADVVKLDRNNRILVEQGMRRVRAGQGNPGIEAMLRMAGRDPRQLVSSDFSFVVGPRLNAAGRLTDMTLGIECLLSDDPQQARQLAAQLDQLNLDRRAIEAEMQAQAEQALASISQTDDDRLGVCLYDTRFHQGVIGILAGRLKQQLHRPVIVFADADELEIKGSARSIPGLHIRDVLDEVATGHPGLIAKFGGHAMAAGLSVPRVHFDDFQQAFDATVRRHLNNQAPQAVVESDGELSPEDFDLTLAEQLRYAGPWGQGFPEPVFDGEFELLQARIVGERHRKLVLRPRGADLACDAIAFNCLEQDWPEPPATVRLAYRLDVNDFNGRRSAQLVIEHFAGPA